MLLPVHVLKYSLTCYRKGNENGFFSQCVIYQALYNELNDISVLFGEIYVRVRKFLTKIKFKISV